MIETGDLKKGVTLEIDGTLYQVIDYHHIKMGRGSAQVRLKLRDVRGGPTIERTVQAGEGFTRARGHRAAAPLKVEQADPWVRGDTAQGGTKPARLETGLLVQVPLFINTGDTLKIDTRSGEYLERAPTQGP